MNDAINRIGFHQVVEDVPAPAPMTFAPQQIIPPGIRNPVAWLKRRDERANAHGGTVNWPELEVGTAVVATTAHKTHVKIIREPRPTSRNKYFNLV